MKLTCHLYRTILESFPSVPPEAGGILGRKKDEIVAFQYDAGNSSIDRAIYVPCINQLNKVIALWASEGISFCGLIHSHPDGREQLSTSDRIFIQQVMNNLAMGVPIFFPLVFPNQKIVGFCAVRTNRNVKICRDPIILTNH